jgi:hypothetical protein
MKKVMFVVLILLLGSAFNAFNAYSEEHQMGAVVSHTKDFEKMKELVGVWEGKMDMGRGLDSLRVTYELTSAGNAIVERFAAGKPHEMVTVYYDFGGKLTMTHYCSLGNQPHMEVSGPVGNALVFILSEKNPGLASLNEMHMHGLKIALEGKDSITNTWTLYDQGAKKSEMSIKLTRIKM